MEFNVVGRSVMAASRLDPKTPKQPKFDDWDSDEEDEPVGHTGADLTDYATFSDFVNKSVLKLKVRREEMRRTLSHDDDPTDEFLDKARKEFMSISDGWVNFKHFNTTITPGLF